MEQLQKLWIAVSTEDKNLTNCIMIFLGFFENYVTMKLFTSTLNIEYTKKQRNIYIIVMQVISIFSTLFIPKEISIFLHLGLTFAVIKLIFKTSILKSILAEVIPTLLILVLESIYAKLCFMLLGKNSPEVDASLIYRVPIMIMIYATILLITGIINLVKSKKSIFKDIDVYRKKILIVNLVFIIVLIAIQFYLFIFYNKVLPLYVTLISLVSLVSYAVVSIYSIIKTINLETTQRELKQSELHNKTLELLYNNVSAFRHDFLNIMTALGGFVYTRNMDGLEKYYKNLVEECHIDNNLSALNPHIINNPAIYNILATKYYKADLLGITINMQIFINLNDLKLDVYDFCRILGILLDNAIEASAKCEKKNINIEIHDFKKEKCQSLIIENTYTNKDVDISRLSEKGYTSKEDKEGTHGIGLWQVSKILKKHKNLVLDTNKNEDYFRQELVIYY